MSHAAKQIRDWFVAACTSVGGLPNATSGTPKQIAPGAEACIVRTTSDSVQPLDIGTKDEHELGVEVELISSTFDGVDDLSALAEEAIANKASFPSESFQLTSRSYTENGDSDRPYVSLTLTYSARYLVARNDVETLI